MAERPIDNSQLLTPPSSPLPQEEEQVEWEGELDQQQGAAEYEEQEYVGEDEDEEEYDEDEEEEGEYDMENAYKDALYFLLPGAKNSRFRKTLFKLFRLGYVIRDRHTRGMLACLDSSVDYCYYPREQEWQTRRQQEQEEQLPLSPHSPKQTFQPALYYYNMAPYRDFPDEPVWDATEPIPMSTEEQEEDRKRVKYHQDTVQDIDQKMEDEFIHYITLANSTAQTQLQQYPQDPLRVSMVLVGSGEGHGEGGGSSSSSASQNAAFYDSDTPYPFSSDDEDEEEESTGVGEKMSSIERTLRAQAVTALHNPSVMLLHSLSMNETPTRTRLRMNRHLTGQPQPPHEYAPESVKQAYRESGGRLPPLDDYNHRQHHHTDTHASPSSASSSSHSAAAAATTHHHHHHHHMDSQSSHFDGDVPMDDEFGPTYFQGALND